MVQVVLVDDHALVREGLRSLLNTYQDLQVVGEAQNGAEAVRMVGRLRPHVVVMDIHMPTMNGIEATKHIKARWPKTTVIGIAAYPSHGHRAEMKRAGAATLLTKTIIVGKLYAAIQQSIKRRKRAQKAEVHASGSPPDVTRRS